jgi:hypothetical protein
MMEIQRQAAITPCARDRAKGTFMAVGHSRNEPKGDSMKLFISLASIIALGTFLMSPAEAQQQPTHRVAHLHHHYHYYARGVVIPPPGYPPPPPTYATFNQPLAPLGWTIGDPDWRERNTLKLLMDNIGDIPYNR